MKSPGDTAHFLQARQSGFRVQGPQIVFLLDFEAAQLSAVDRRASDDWPITLNSGLLIGQKSTKTSLFLAVVGSRLTVVEHAAIALIES
jgi:hypothetical protein